MIVYRLECSFCGVEHGTAYAGDTLRHVHRVTTLSAGAIVRFVVTK